jgi:hypothetical protein
MSTFINGVQDLHSALQVTMWVLNILNILDKHKYIFIPSYGSRVFFKSHLEWYTQLPHIFWLANLAF